MLADTLYGWAPLALAALGVLWSERAGKLCVAVEGFTALGAFCVFALYRALSQAAPGLNVYLVAALAILGGVLGCAVCAGVLAAGIFRFRLNPFVAGLAFNLAAGGVCTLLVRAAGGGGTGVVRLTGAPLLREAFFVLALLAVVLVHLALRSTVFGFRLRASGLSEEAARESGVDAAFYGAAGWALASCGAALAGAAALFRLGAYVSYGAAGRSWLAIAAVFMGFKRPFLTALAALLFSFAQVASGAAQKSAAFPPPLLNALPYALALVVYALAGRLNTLPPERRVSRQKNAG